MLLVQLPECLLMPLLILLLLATVIPDANLLATPIHRAPRVPATSLPAVGVADGGAAPPLLPRVDLVGNVAPPPHHVVGLVGPRLLPLGVLLASPRLLPLVGRTQTSSLG